MPLKARDHLTLDDFSIECFMDDMSSGRVIRVLVDPAATLKQDHLGIPLDIILRIASEKYDRGEHADGALVVTADDIMG